jgi:hypothetical protein
MTPTVFLCEPTGLSRAQRSMSDWWHECLFGLGFNVEQLRRRQYQRDPWQTLLQFFDLADGVLVLALRQLIIDSGGWRRGTCEHVELAATAWTSPWLQAETGMALAAGLPVLVAPESGIREGVFAEETWIGALSGTSAEAPRADVIDQWASAVIARSTFATTRGTSRSISTPARCNDDCRTMRRSTTTTATTSGASAGTSTSMRP